VVLSEGRSRFRVEDTLIRRTRPNAIAINRDGTVIDSFTGNRITENEQVGAVTLDWCGTRLEWSGDH